MPDDLPVPPDADADAEYMAAIAEMEAAMPPIDVLIRWAERHPPPQSWYDEDDDLL